ncbi:hypothetical protein DFH09DRAFT_916174, partial [Mycena vulgaris]
FHVRFVATSPFASPLEIMQGVRGSIKDTFSEPVVAWDCEAKEEVLHMPCCLPEIIQCRPSFVAAP